MTGGGAKGGGSGNEGDMQSKLLSIDHVSELRRENAGSEGDTLSHTDHGDERCAIEGVEKNVVGKR